MLGKHKDTFKAKITDERRLELLRQVTAKRQEQSEQDIRNLRCEAIDDAYRKKFSDYQRDEQAAERERIQGLQHLYQLDVMQYYFVNFNKDELARAQADNGRALPPHSEDGTDAENTHAEVEWTKAAQGAAARLQKIQLWSQVDEGDPMDKEDRRRLLKEHEERLKRYRQRKDWENDIEEDDQDIDGDRILAEIRNYKSEYFFNTNFYS